MNTDIYNTDGEARGELDLPSSFSEPHRPDLVRRAFLSAQANEKQSYGADEYAGMRTSAESWGSGRGSAHVPRINSGSRAARVPHAVGGRKAHPPKAEKKHGESINEKEKQKAVRSAAAMTVDSELVEERGHIFSDEVELPVVFNAELEELEKTREVVGVLEELGLYRDVERADEGRKTRPGKGKMRGRRHREPRSILFVTKDEFRAARNLPGVDISTAENVGIKELAPGGVGGRLTVWTETALEVFSER